MKHKIGYNRLGRKASHRKALHRNMVASLFRYERIKTTKAKAGAVRRTAEKMITRAKEDTVHNRRMIARSIGDKAVLAKLFTEIAPRNKTRNGGYTRVLKVGNRLNDASEMVILELVSRAVSEETDTKKKKKKKDKRAAEESEKQPGDETAAESEGE